MVSFRHTFPADAHGGNSGHLVLPELPEERAHIYIYPIWSYIIQEGAREMIQWPTALHTLAEDPSLFLEPTWQVTTIHNFVYRGFNTAPDLHRHQAFTWYRQTCRKIIYTHKIS